MGDQGDRRAGQGGTSARVVDNAREGRAGVRCAARTVARRAGKPSGYRRCRADHPARADGGSTAGDPARSGEARARRHNASRRLSNARRRIFRRWLAAASGRHPQRAADALATVPTVAGTPPLALDGTGLTDCGFRFRIEAVSSPRFRNRSDLYCGGLAGVHASNKHGRSSGTPFAVAALARCVTIPAGPITFPMAEPRLQKSREQIGRASVFPSGCSPGQNSFLFEQQEKRLGPAVGLFRIPPRHIGLPSSRFGTAPTTRRPRRRCLSSRTRTSSGCNSPDRAAAAAAAATG